MILRAIPYWREVGTGKWIEDEEARYLCPDCGNTLFRGVVTCNRCKAEVDLTDTKVDYEPITPIELDVRCLENDVSKPGNQAGK